MTKSVSKRLGRAEVGLSTSFDIEVASGNLPRESYATHQIRLKIEECKERLRYEITDIQRHEIILGVSWLERHDPRVDWRTRQLWLTIEGEELELKPASETPIDGLEVVHAVRPCKRAVAFC